MKISIKSKIPTSISLDPKHKSGYKTIEKQVEVEDKLIVKYVALIDELFDRTSDELENRTWKTVAIPLVPFPFFAKYREPENIALGAVMWPVFWAATSINDNISERSKIIQTLYELGGIDGIEKDPTVDLTGQLNGTDFIVSINREELGSLRTVLFVEFKKQQEQKRLHTIDLSDVDFPQALYLLRAVYNKVMEILDAVCRGPIIMSDTRINLYYTILLKTVHDILELKGFEELKRDTPELFESLVGDMSDVDMEWEYSVGPATRNFFAKIEKLYIISGAKVCSLPRGADENFVEADKAVQEYRKQVNAHWSKKLKNIDEEKERVENKIIKKQESQRKSKEIIDALDDTIIRGLKNMSFVPPEPVQQAKPTRKTLRGKIIEFDETRSAVVIDNKHYQLPPAQNEDNLTRVMFRHRVGEFVDWSMIYGEMTGVNSQETDIESPKNMKMVRDTVNRLNNRLQELLNTEDELLTWKNKSICRNY
jgi:hypothetical protein